MIDNYLQTIQEGKESIVIKELPIKQYSILEPLYKEFVVDTAKKTTFKYKNKSLKQKMDQVSKTKKHIILVAYDRGLPVGFMFGTIDDKGNTGQLHGAIAQLVVSKKYRGKGIAKDLWVILNKWLDDNGSDIKWVTSLAGNTEAIGLYKSFGFKPEMLTLRQ